MRYRVNHRTTYSYDDDVSDSLGIGHVVPRVLPWQQVASYDVSVTPVPGDLSHDVDYYGNVATYFQVTEPHRVLEVEATSDVDVQVRAYDHAALAQPWEQARPLLAPATPGAWRAADFALESALAEHTEQARAYAAVSLTPHRPLGEAVTDLVGRIHAEFQYDKAATTVTSMVEDIFEKAAGVCQDFAHLTIACLRSHGLAARYVSGYLATTPPPGRDRVVGADATPRVGRRVGARLGRVAGPRPDQRPVGRRPPRHRRVGPRLRRRATGERDHLHRRHALDAAGRRRRDPARVSDPCGRLTGLVGEGLPLPRLR